MRQAIALNETECKEAQAELVKLINEYRLSNGVAAMATDSRVQNAANIRAKEIKESFSHVRPDGKDFRSILEEVGIVHYVTGGENIAKSYGAVNDPVKSAQMLFDSWKQSSGHNASMLNDKFTTVAFGVYADETGIYSSTVFVTLAE